MTINVTKYRLNPDRVFAGTRGSYGMEKLSFDFGDGWDFETLCVTFHPQRSKPIQIPILPGVEIDIPPEVMAHSGESRFVVSGKVLGEDGTIERQAITLEGRVDVAHTASEKGGNSRKITPDVYDSLILQATELFNDAREDVENSAENAQKSAAAAEKSETAAKSSEDQAKTYESSAKTSAEAAEQSENEAKKSETAAVGAANTAESAADRAEAASGNAAGSAQSAAESKESAAQSADEAKIAMERAEAVNLFPMIDLFNIEPGALGGASGYMLHITNADGTIRTANIYNGTDGKNGTDGVTPTIGSNGNWWIGNVDTGVLARGVSSKIKVTRNEVQKSVTITASDADGATFAVVYDGKDCGLPAITDADEDKVLRVKGGKAAWVSLINGEEVKF